LIGLDRGLTGTASLLPLMSEGVFGLIFGSAFSNSFASDFEGSKLTALAPELLADAS